MRRFELLEQRSVLSSAPLLWDGFSGNDYTQGNGLVDTDPAIAGFDGAWNGSGTARVSAGGLVYPGFGSAGDNHVDVESSMVVSRLLAGGVSDPLGNYVDGNGDIGSSANGAPLYLSFLMQIDGSSPPASTFSLYNNGTSSSDREFRILYSSGNTHFAAIAGPSGGSSDLSPLNNVTNLFVLRIDFAAGNDTISIWQNPTAGASESAPDAQINNYDIAFDRVAFSRFQGIGSAKFDELRMGDEWAAVTDSDALNAIPQPPLSADGFDASEYPAGTSVDGVWSYIAGYDGEWSTLEQNNVVAGSLTYAGYGNQGGNRLRLLGTDIVSRQFLTGNNAHLANYVDSNGDIGDSADGTALYFSFLMQVDGTSPPSATFSLYDGGTTPQLREFRILYSHSNSNFQAITGESGSLAELGPLNSGTNLFVIRIDFAAGNDTISIWQNPAIDADEPTPDAQITDFDISFDRLALTRFAGTGSVDFDELRIGRQWLAVTDQAALALPPGPREIFAMQGNPPSPLESGLYPDGFFPFIDQFGQYRYTDWPEKIDSLDELLQAASDEAADLVANPGPSDFNQYGGWAAGPLLTATGFFRVEKFEGKWWLVDPDGRLFFSNGITGVGDAGREDSTSVAVKTGVSGRESYFSDVPQSGDSAEQFLISETSTVTSGEYQGSRPVTMNFFAANAKAKYGPHWEQVSQDVAHDRLRSWGMNTIGAWSDEEVYLQQRTPYTMMVFSPNPSLINGNGTFPDYFDPQYRSLLENRILDETGKSLNDPYNIGYFINNELGWTRSFTEDIDVGLATLAATATQHAKIALRDQLMAKYVTIAALNVQWQTAYVSWNDFLSQRNVIPDPAGANDDLLAFDQLYANQYHSETLQALRSVAPNHLYLGTRFTGGVRYSAAVAAMTYADVVSINRYGPDVSVLPAGLEGDKPLISGEYHFSANDTGLWSDGLKTADDQADRADKFSTYLQSALESDRYVGVHWLQYLDFPSAGKLNSNNNNSNLGFVTIADQPYEEMVAAARAIGDNLYQIRYGGEYESLAGDYDGNRVVDQQDYTVWKQYFGTTSPVADGNADGTVNLADYVVWRNNLGASLPDPVVSSIQSTTTESDTNQEDLSAAKSLDWPVFDTEGDDSDRPQAAATEGKFTVSGEMYVPFALESSAGKREAGSRDRDFSRPGVLDIAYSEWLEGMSGAVGSLPDFEGFELD